MPLSTPAPREPVYSRDIECRCFLRPDGLWDIEGHLHDARLFPSRTDFHGMVPAGAPVHVMSMRMTVAFAVIELSTTSATAWAKS